MTRIDNDFENEFYRKDNMMHRITVKVLKTKSENQ